MPASERVLLALKLVELRLVNLQGSHNFRLIDHDDGELLNLLIRVALNYFLKFVVELTSLKVSDFSPDSLHHLGQIFFLALLLFVSWLIVELNMETL